MKLFAPYVLPNPTAEPLSCESAFQDANNSANHFIRRTLSQPAKIFQFRRLLGLDSQVISTLVFRAWTVAAGGIMIFLIPVWLTQVEQGYYYTFGALLALQLFFELGMNQVVIQIVSHDFAHLDSPDAALRVRRLTQLLALLKRWYRIASVLFFLAVSAGGAVFFQHKGQLPPSAWLAPWILMVACTAFNLYWSVQLTFLEGCGEVAEVARMRVVQSLAGNIFLWLAIACHAGLWAMTLVPAMAVIYSGLWLRQRPKVVHQFAKFDLLDTAVQDNISWKRDIFPVQWRIAVSWISGYFIFQLFTPLAFAKSGAIDAGRLGISLAVFNALNTVAMSWVNAKVPAMAAYISRGDNPDALGLFVSVLKRSMAFIIIMTLAMVGLSALVTALDLPVAQRFVSLPVMLCIAAVTVANAFVFAAAAFMRAHKEEPMMAVSVVSALATLAIVSWLARFGVLPMMASYAAVVLGLSLPWTLLIFKRYVGRSSASH